MFSFSCYGRRARSFILILFLCFSSWNAYSLSCRVFIDAQPKVESPFLDQLVDYVAARRTVPSMRQLADLRSLDDFLAGEVSFEPGSRLPLMENGVFAPYNSLVADFRFAQRFVPDLQFEHFLRQLEINPRLFKYFDPATGDFKLGAFERFNLAPENGDVPLSALRINLPKYLVAPTSFEYRARLQTFLRDLRQILRANSEVEIWIVANYNRAVQSFLSSRIKDFSKEERARVKIIEVPEDVNLNVWAQDGSKPLANGRGTLAKPYENRPDMDYTTSTMALRNIGVEVKSGDLYFEGGNVIVSSRHVFVGADIVSEIMLGFGVNRRQAVKALEAEFNSTVIEVGIPLFLEGAMRQIDFHIDLSMAVVRNKVTQKETAVIQSPLKLFEEILGVSGIMDMTAPMFDSLVLDYIKSVRRAVQKRERPDLSDNERRFLSELGNTNFFRLLKREKMYSVLARQMEDLGYEVERVPGLNRVNHQQQLSKIFNYTNIIVDKNHIIAPLLGIPKLDNMAYETFQRLGYTVIPMVSAPLFLLEGGGIRCACETFRGEGDSPGK